MYVPFSVAIAIVADPHNRSFTSYGLRSKQSSATSSLLRPKGYVFPQLDDTNSNVVSPVHSSVLRKPPCMYFYDENSCLTMLIILQ